MNFTRINNTVFKIKTVFIILIIDLMFNINKNNTFFLATYGLLLKNNENKFYIIEF